MQGWNKKIKTIMLHPEHGRIKTEMSAIDILREPNRHQYESLTHAMCVCVHALVEAEEQRTARVEEVARRLRGSHEPVHSEISETDLGSGSGDSGGDERRRGDEQSL